MKTNLIRTLKMLLTAACLLPFAASAKSVEAPKLQVRIDLPPMMDSLREDDIADAVAARLSDVFRRQGFEGRIDQLNSLDDADATIPTIEVRVLEWRPRASGIVSYTMTADVIGADGSKTRLGPIDGSAMSWNLRDQWNLARAYEDAANDAMRTLWKKFQSSNASTAAALQT